MIETKETFEYLRDIREGRNLVGQGAPGEVRPRLCKGVLYARGNREGVAWVHDLLLLNLTASAGGPDLSPSQRDALTRLATILEREVRDEDAELAEIEDTILMLDELERDGRGETPDGARRDS